MLSSLVSFKRCERHAHQFVFIEAPINIVADLALEWGDPIWWPKGCRIRYHAPAGSTPLSEGKEYQIALSGPCPLSWQARIMKYVSGVDVELDFTSGALTGHERINLEERSNGTRIDHDMHYRVRGVFNQIIWQLFYAHHYHSWINTLLLTIKEYSEKLYAERQASV